MKTSIIFGLLILFFVYSCKSDENYVTDMDESIPSIISNSRSSGFNLSPMGQYHNDIVQLAYDYEAVHGSNPSTSHLVDTADVWLYSQYNFNIKPVPSSTSYTFVDSLLDGLVDVVDVQDRTAELLEEDVSSQIYNADELNLLKRVTRLSTLLDTSDLRDSLAVYEELIASITWTGNNGDMIKSVVDIYDHSITLWTSPALTPDPITSAYCSVCTADALTYVYEFTTNLAGECKNYFQCDNQDCPDCLADAGLNVGDAIDAHRRVALALAAIASFGSN